MRPFVILNVLFIDRVCMALLVILMNLETLLIHYSTPVVCVFINRDVHTVNSGQGSQY